ncbi:hypothetical protein, partial [Mesorhizobium sp. M1A.F.Ca.IN.020.06.1.1]
MMLQMGKEQRLLSDSRPDGLEGRWTSASQNGLRQGVNRMLEETVVGHHPAHAIELKSISKVYGAVPALLRT